MQETVRRLKGKNTNQLYDYLILPPQQPAPETMGPGLFEKEMELLAVQRKLEMVEAELKRKDR